MACVKIRLEDESSDGTMGVTVESDPPFEVVAGARLTAAQLTAVDLMERLSRIASSQDPCVSCPRVAERDEARLDEAHANAALDAVAKVAQQLRAALNDLINQLPNDHHFNLDTAEAAACAADRLFHPEPSEPA